MQVTRGDTHSFKIEFFGEFLKNLKNSEQTFDIRTLEVVFVVLQEKLANFRISTVSGQGSLSSVEGWESVEETSKVKIFGIMGWES